MSYSNIAAVVVHMQNDFLGEIKEEVGRPMYDAQLEVLQYFANQNLPIYVVELLSSTKQTLLEKTIPELVKIAEQSSHYTEIRDKNANVFTNTNIGDQLREKEIRTLLFMGVWESYCVYQNVNSALKLGFSVMACEQLMANPAYEKRIRESWFKINNLLVDYNEILKEL